MSTTPDRNDSEQVLLRKILALLEAGGGGGGGAGVESFNGRTGAVTLTLADVSAVADSRYLKLSGGTLTGGLSGPLGEFAELAISGAATITTLTANAIEAITSLISPAATINNLTSDELSVANSVGFFGTTPAAQPSSPLLTNNLSSGGVDDQLADYTDLVIYSMDAVAIHDNLFQLGRKVREIQDALASLGIIGP